jgi:glycosyltransferase involved in cell wall biosynthesis
VSSASPESWTRARLGYVCGALRVSTHENAEAVGPRAHVVGFMNGLNSVGVSPRTYLAGDQSSIRRMGRVSDETMRGSMAKRYLIDAARLGFRYAARQKAVAALGAVDIVYERQATFQDLGRPFQRKGSKWIIESNGPFWYEAAEERHSLALVKAARRLELQAYRDADLVVAVSEALKEIIASESGRNPDRIFVLPNATDPQRFDPARVTPERVGQAPVIGFVGYLAEWAGLDVLIQAIAQLNRSKRRLGAVIVGDGPARTRLERLAISEGVDRDINFLGHVEWSRVPSLLSGMDLAFSGQREMAIGSMYHSPQKLYEYQAMGLPVVASDYPDSRALLTDRQTGFLFDGGNVTSLVETLEKALRADSLEGLGSRARDLILESHSWEARVRTLLTELTRRGILA